MSGRPSVSPRCAEAITPAAGPDSTMNTGRTLAASEPKMPPLDCITSSFASNARRRQPALDPLQVPLDDGADDGVDHRCRRAQVLPELGRDVGRERDGNARELLREDRADPLLVLRIDVGVEEADGDRLDPFASKEAAASRTDASSRGRQHLALRAEPLGDDDRAVARDEGLRLLELRVVQGRAYLAGDLEQVAKPVRRDEAAARDVALR